LALASRPAESKSRLPREAVATLGHIAFPGRQQGQLLRVGNKLVLVSFSNAGADVITEVTDPLEVDRLAGLCAQADPHGAVRSFREVVDGFFRERPTAAAGAARRGMLAEEDDVVYKASTFIARRPRLPAAARAALALLVTCIVIFAGASSFAQESSNSPAKLTLSPDLLGGPNQWTSPEGLTSALQVMLLLTVVSLAPALLMMTTCFVRAVVLGLLRQRSARSNCRRNKCSRRSLCSSRRRHDAGRKQTYDEAIVPYTNHQIGLDEADAASVRCDAS
jgi:hypothetical protein